MKNNTITGQHEKKKKKKKRIKWRSSPLKVIVWKKAINYAFRIS